MSTLTIEVVPDEDGDDFPRATLLVDGIDRLKDARGTGFRGFSAMAMLDDASVLLPAARPCRVALYVCSCGEAGCGSLAAVVDIDEAGRIRWSDFHDFTAVFDGPVELSNPQGDDPFSRGKATDVPDFVFDRGQYEAEVRRAVADKSWESDARRLDRLLAQLLRENEAGRLEQAGLEFGRVWTTARSSDAAKMWIELRPVASRSARGSGQSVMMTMTAGPGSPEAQAADISSTLSALPVEEWEPAFRYVFLRDS